MFYLELRLTNVSLSDPLVTNSGGAVILVDAGSNLALSQNKRYRAYYTVTETDAYNEEITNVATFTSSNGVSVTATHNSTVDMTFPILAVAHYSLTIEKHNREGKESFTEGEVTAWNYIVTNNGNVIVDGITVTDDKGVIVTCPYTTLSLEQSMTCTGTGEITYN